MDRENKIDLGANIIKLGLAIGSVLCPEAGVASAAIDVTLSAVKSFGLLKETNSDSVDGQLKDCISNVFTRIQRRELSATHKELIETYIIPQFELWLNTGDLKVMQDGNIDSLFNEWSNSREAHREMYLTEQDIRKVNGLFMELFKDEILDHPKLADWYNIKLIKSLDKRFGALCDNIFGRMEALEQRVAKLEKPINPNIEEILRKEPKAQLWEASKSAYEIGKQEGQRFAYDIIERLLPRGYVPKLTVPIEGKTEAGEKRPLVDLCNAISDHVAIIGNGGTGKTTFLQHLMGEIFRQSLDHATDSPVPVFVELNRCPANIGSWYDESLRKTNFITRYIGSLLENHTSLNSVDPRILDYIEKELQKRPKEGNPQYILLLDGFNEVKVDEGYGIRSMLSNEISIIKNYANVRIITTSRETQAAYYAADFKNIRLTGLMDSDILNHLRKCNKPEYFIGEVNKNKHLMECLRIPLYLCMFASSTEENLLPETQGEILYFFFHRNSTFYNIRKRASETRTNPLNELQTQLVLDFILPYIGFCFERDDIFSVNAKNFSQMILEAVEGIRVLFLSEYNPFADFHYSGIYLRSTLDSLTENGKLNTSKIIECVFDYLGIIYQYQINEGHYAERLRYAFCHHSFRDYFSAIWNVQLLRMLPQTEPAVFSVTSGNSDISYDRALNSGFWSVDKVALISEILMEHRNKPCLESQNGNWYMPEAQYDEQSVLAATLDACRKLENETDIHYLLANVLSSILYGREELTFVDLHGLDLSHSNFFNVICSRKGRSTTVGADFCNATLVKDCFFPQNHQDCIIEYIYNGKQCITLDDSGLIKCWDVVSGKFEYEIMSGDPVGIRDNSTKGYMRISRSRRWLGVKVQESLSTGMSIKLHIYDLYNPTKPPICLLPECKHNVLSYFAFSDDSECVVLICDSRHVYCYDLSGKMLSKQILSDQYGNNEIYFASSRAPAYIISYEYDPYKRMEFYDEEYEKFFDEDTDEEESEVGVPCVVWQWDMKTGEMEELYSFFGAEGTIPTITYLAGKNAFLIYDGEKKKIEYFDYKTRVLRTLFTSITNEKQEPPASFHQYVDKPALCLIMYPNCCYLSNIEEELRGNNGVLKWFTTEGIERKMREKGLATELYFSTNVAPSYNQFLAFDDNAKTYEWDSENDTIRAKYNSAFYDTAYLAVNSDRSNAYLVHSYNGISQFSKNPLKLEYQHCYEEQGYSVNVGSSDEAHDRVALAFADLGHEKVIVVDLSTYSEKTIFSTIMPSETVVDLSFSNDGTKVLITTQYKCVEFNLITEQELTIAESIGKERFVYGNYADAQIEITVVEGEEEGLPTRCEYYSRVETSAGSRFIKEWYYVVPELPDDLFQYFVHSNGDLGKEGPHDEDGIQKYRLTRGFFLEEWPEFAHIMSPECYRLDGDTFVTCDTQFRKLEMICVHHVKALFSRGTENRITIMYMDMETGEAILSRNSADLAWMNDLRSVSYKRIVETFDRHIGNEKGYYCWNYVVPWQDNKMLGCFETYQIVLVDRDTGERTNPVKYEPGLSLTGCMFTNINANDDVKSLIKSSGANI